MTRQRARCVVMCVAAAALVGCGDSVTGTASPAATSSFVRQYADAGAALDTATTTWDALGQALVTANTNTVANEAPIDAAYARALQAFSSALLAIQFPASATDDVHSGGQRRGAVRNDLAGVASGAVHDAIRQRQSHLQAAINVVQQELGLGSSTPIAG